MVKRPKVLFMVLIFCFSHSPMFLSLSIHFFIAVLLHQISNSLLIYYFYEKLVSNDTSAMDAAVEGALVNKTPIEDRILVSTMTTNNK